MRVLLIIALLGVTPALAQMQTMTPAAKLKLDRGMKLASERKFDEAIKELRAGYALSETREFLYALGQAERLRGDCKRALVHYNAFVDTDPPADQLSAAKVQISRCEAEVAAAEPKPAPAPVAQPAPAPAPEPKAEPKPEPKVAAVEKPVVTVSAPAPKPWYTDAVGDVLLISGAVVAAGGATAFIAGNVAAQNSGTSLDNYAAAKGLSWAQPVGIIGMGVGAAAVVGAIIRFATMNPSTPAPAATSLGFAPTATGGVLVLSGGF